MGKFKDTMCKAGKGIVTTAKFVSTVGSAALVVIGLIAAAKGKDE